MKKYCTRCGHEFEAVGREVICPECKAVAAEETKRAAVERAKRASWSGESVPVRISGRASTVVREYGKANNMPFAQALDALLKASDYFVSTGKAWEDVTPYKSRRRDKATSTTEDAPEDAPQAKQDVKQDAPQAKQDVKPQAAKQAAKTTAKKAAKTVKTVAGKKVTA